MMTGSARENANITIDAGMQRVIDRCTAFSPEKRYASIGQVRQALSGAGRPVGRIDPRILVPIVLAAVMLLWAGFAVGRFTEWLRPVQKTEFQEALIERAVRLQLGKEKGDLTKEDLAQVKQIYIYGTEAFADPELFYQCTVDTSTQGPIRSLDDLALLPGLEEVHIIHQLYVDTSGLAGHPRLYTVELKHMRLSGAAPIADIPGLRHAILFSTHLSDVTALENCPWLETLDIGRNNIKSLAQIGSHPNVTSLGLMWLEMDDVNDIARRMPKVQAVTLQHSAIGDLSGLKALPALQAVYVLEEQADAVRELFRDTNVQVNVTEN